MTPGCGRLIRGDNLAVMSELSDELRDSVTLAYLDPPFLTGRVHHFTDRASRETRPAFDDRWPGRDEYIAALRERLGLIRELLAPWGCAVIHVDPKTSHYVKIGLDAYFGADHFASEIIWRYRRWPSKTQNFQRVHDVPPTNQFRLVP